MSRQQRAKNASLLTIDDKDLVRHSALAYHDGYADARDYGRNGFFCPEHYNAYDRESYAQGFKRGYQVYRVATGTQ